MATTLHENLKQKVKTLELEPGGGGCFEVFVNGDLLYSKLQTGEFPDENQILDEVVSQAA